MELMSEISALSHHSRRTVCIIVAMALTAASAFAEGYPKGSGYIDGSIHWESRDLVGDFVNFDIVAGYDFLIWDGFDLYLGPRVGLFTETVATAYMGPDLAVYWPITAGGQIHFLYPILPTKDLVLTCGAAADLFLYLDAIHWSASDFQPVFIYTEVFLGLRYYIADLFHIEARVDAGTMAFWSDSPVFLKLGILAGFDL
jgi:hypothetical protein